MEESARLQHGNENRRILFLQSLGSYIPIFGVLISIGYGIIYWNTQAWQLWGTAGVSLLGSLIFIFAGWILRRGKSWLAAFVMILTSAAILPGYAFFWSGMKIVWLIGAWAVPLALIFFGMKPGIRRALSGLIGFITTGLIILVENVQPIERLDVTDPDVIRWLVPLLVIVGGFLVLLLVTRTILILRLFTRLLISFLTIILIAVVTISVISTFNSLDTDRQYAVNSLNTAATLRENEVIEWLSQIQNDLREAYQGVEPRTDLLEVLGNPSHQPNPFYGSSIDRFTNIINKTGSFEEIFLLNKEGIVVAATDPGREGVDFAFQDFFLEAREDTYIQLPIYFEPANETSLFVAHPILDRQTRMAGIIVGRTDLQTITQIVSSRTGLGITGKAYLVGNDFLLLSQWVTGESTNKIVTAATEIALTLRQDGILEYQSHNGIDVIGIYHWMPELDAIMIAEMSTQEAFQGVQRTIRTNVIVATLAFVIAIIGAVVLVRTITDPIDRLTSASSRLAAGDFQARADIVQEDEIGQMAQSFNRMAGQLQGLVHNLEERVAERTRDVERRVLELQVAAEIARDASRTSNLNDLLARSARLIHERFGFYHTGIFLLDDKKEFAVLRAAGGEAGKLLLASNHKLKVGETGLVGNVTLTGKPRIALDTGEDSTYFRNPLLPYTRSEMALPIIVREKVIGVLEIQSEEMNAFDENDIAIIQIIADQLAITVEKIQLLQEVEQSAINLERGYREYTTQTWRTFLGRAGGKIAYTYEGSVVQPLTTLPDESQKVLASGQMISIAESGGTSDSVLAVPIKIRDQAIGVLRIKYEGQQISTETQSLIQEAADRLALALENTRLIQDAILLAQREQQINLITAQTQQSVDLNAILQNTIRELGNALGTPRTFIQIGLPQTTSQDFE